MIRNLNGRSAVMEKAVVSSVTAHMLGDYVLQSDWMALNKTTHSRPAAAHALTYALPFLAITRSPWRLGAIAGTHFVIDRWRLARYVVWAKNQLVHSTERYPFTEAGTSGYHRDRDALTPWMTFWLLIAADNALHLLINDLALGVRR